jgi:hypothetical protein
VKLGLAVLNGSGTTGAVGDDSKSLGEHKAGLEQEAVSL